jgi:hypothetical protein
LIFGALVSTSNAAFSTVDDNSKTTGITNPDSVDRARRAALRDLRKLQREQQRVEKAEADMKRQIELLIKDEVNSKYRKLALLIGIPMAFILLVAFRRRNRRRQMLEGFMRNKGSGPNIQPLDRNKNADLPKNL